MAINLEKLIGELDDLDALALSRLIQAAQERRASRLEEARRALIAEIREKAAALDLSLEDLVAPPARKSGGARGRKRGQVAPRYRGPDGETWSGRGRAPRWLAALEAQGHKREQYRVADSPERSRDLLSGAETEGARA